MIIYNSKIFKLPFIRNYVGITLTSKWMLFKDSKEQVYDRLKRHEMGHGIQFIITDTAAIKGQFDGVMIMWITYLLSYVFLFIKHLFSKKAWAMRDEDHPISSVIAYCHWKAYKGIIWERLAREFEVV